MGDVGCGVTRSSYRVVARIRPRQCHAAHRYRLAGGGVFVAKRAGAVDCDCVASYAVVAGGDRGGGGCVVHLVHAGISHRQGFGRHIGAGCAATGRQNIVARVGAAQAHAGHIHCFGGAHVFVGKSHGARYRQHIAAHAVVAGSYGAAGGAVVHLIHSGVA